MSGTSESTTTTVRHILFQQYLLIDMTTRMRFNVKIDITDKRRIKQALEAKFNERYDVVFEPFYAIYVEYGTEPHPVGEEGIKNLTKWCELKFGMEPEEARQVAEKIAWKIRHHGTKAHPFLRPAVDMYAQLLPNLFRAGYKLKDVAEMIEEEAEYNLVFNDSVATGELLTSHHIERKDKLKRL